MLQARCQANRLSRDCAAQIVPVLQASLKAFEAAGAVLVEVDVGLLLRTYDVEAPNKAIYQVQTHQLAGCTQRILPASEGCVMHAV